MISITVGRIHHGRRLVLEYLEHRRWIQKWRLSLAVLVRQPRDIMT